MNEDDDRRTYSVPKQEQSDFTVIWHNLTYKVDSRRWYTKVKGRLLRSVHDAKLSNSHDTSRTIDGKRIILNRVCGSASSRQLTAIMGPSGAGKSSLLHCLFQNRTAGTTGQILVESQSVSRLKVCFIPQKDHLNEWLTVREDLIFVSKLKSAKINNLIKEGSNTLPSGDDPLEHDSFVSQTQGKPSTTLIDHEANAIYVAELLGLSNCLDVTVKNVSGGQKKRLSIARELMSKPDILILDEPTTGLDSLTCHRTVMVLRDLARLSPNPMAVIVTIHQPQREVFNLFDKTYFLSNKGRVIYEGCPKRVGETIENIALVRLPAPNYNPASFLIEIASDEIQESVIRRMAAFQQAQFYKKYDQLYLKRLVKSRSGINNSQNWKFCTIKDKSLSLSEHSLIYEIQHPVSKTIDRTLDLDRTGVDIETKELTSVSSDNTSSTSEFYYISHQLSNCLSSHSNNILQSFRHIFILTHRSWLSVIRNPTFTRSRFVFHTLLPLMMLVVFGTDMGKPNNCPKLETQLNIEGMSKNINNGLIAKNVEETRLSLENLSFFFILMYGFAINIISTTASFYPLTMHMFKKETINGLYSPAPYFIAQTLADLPLELLFPSISILLSYPLSGQMPSFLEWRMFSVAYIVFLVGYTIHSLGLLCGSIFVNNVNVSVLLGQSCLLPFVMLSGFLIRSTRMSSWMRKLSYISPFKHGLTGVMTARYGFNVCECDDEMISDGGEKVSIQGMTPQVKHVIDYMFPRSNSTDTNSSDNLVISEVFEKLSQRFVDAQTFALDIKTCDDVKPYVMHVCDAEDSDLFYSVLWLTIIIIVFKFMTFSLLKSFPYRID